MACSKDLGFSDRKAYGGPVGVQAHGVVWATGATVEVGEMGVFGACSEGGLDGPCSLMR